MIKANVYYDKQALVAFMRFSVIDRPWKWIAYAAMFIFALMLVIFNIGNSFLPYAIILLVFVCIVDSLVIFAYFINPALKHFSDENTVLNRFSFEENVIKLDSESKKRKGSSELPYSVFTKIDESRTTFYLFVNKTSALIVTKASITEGSEDELRKFLISKIPNKKINKLSAK